MHGKLSAAWVIGMPFETEKQSQIPGEGRGRGRVLSKTSAAKHLRKEERKERASASGRRGSGRIFFLKKISLPPQQISE